MPELRRILCPTDLSSVSRSAVAYGADLARRTGAELFLVHAIPPPAYPPALLTAVAALPELQQELRRRVEADLSSLRDELGDGLTVHVIVRDGLPHDEILATAAENGCDLIVIATHGHTGWKHAMLGSTAERLVRLSPVPVLTLRVPPAD